MMVNVLVCGYATGVFSSQKLIRRLRKDVAFKMLATLNYPAHRTICDSRTFHLKALAKLSVQVVKFGEGMQLDWARHDWVSRGQARTY
jgi:transposase